MGSDGEEDGQRTALIQHQEENNNQLGIEMDGSININGFCLFILIFDQLRLAFQPVAVMMMMMMMMMVLMVSV